MTKKTKFKEAIKVAMAFAIVYGIALKLSWMNPSWAGFAVVMISLPTMGQTIHKGLNRLAGTGLALITALFVFSLAPQNRWLFIFLAASWIAFTTYKMISSKNNPYFWNVAGFVCLIILVSSPITSENVFYHALYRALETAMGIMVYTLITFFIWPINNKGAINKAANELLLTQLNRIKEVKAVLSGKMEAGKLVELGRQNMQKIDRLNEVLVAEGSENYNASEELHHWQNILNLSTSLYDCQNRLETYIPELKKCDVFLVLPTLNDFINEIDQRFEQIQHIINNNNTSFTPANYKFDIDQQRANQLSVFDKAAIEVSRRNLEQINDLSFDLFNSLTGLINGSYDKSVGNKNLKQAPENWFTFPDFDKLKMGLYAGIVTFIGFCIWIFFNPTGHAGWYSMGGIIAMIVASAPQAKIIMIFKPMALILPLGILVYVFIMPTLSTLFELGVLLFTCMFLVRYFFSGLAQLAGGLAIINMLAIQNQQQYSFAAMFNGYLFTLAIIVFSFGVSYFINASRPEKVVLKYMNRFFVNAEYLFHKALNKQDQKIPLFQQWKINYYRKELKKIPAKINSWSSAIDHQLFPNIKPDQIKEIITSLDSLVYHIEALFEFEEIIVQNSIMKDDLLGDLQYWNATIEETFAAWSQNPNTIFEENKKDSFNKWIQSFENKVQEGVEHMSTTYTTKDVESFYRVLGGYRGVSEAVLNYAQHSKKIDWKQWKEERFS